MKSNIVIGLVATLVLFGCGDKQSSPSADSAKSGAAKSTAPPAGFEKSQLQFAFGDNGDPGRAEMTVEDVVKPFIDKGVGKWSKLSETEWMLDVNTEDKVTNKKANMRLVFDKQAQLKGDVLFKRLVADGQDASQLQIANFLTMVKQNKQ